MRVFYIFIVLLLINSTAIAGPKLKNIKGSVIGIEKETLAGAKIEVKGTDIVVYSDLDGEFTIDRLKSGTYSLVVTLISYQDLEVERMELTAENTDKLVFKLRSR